MVPLVELLPRINRTLVARGQENSYARPDPLLKTVGSLGLRIFTGKPGVQFNIAGATSQVS